MRFVLFATCALVSCAPRLADTTIIDHRRVSLEADRPAVVESSGAAPRWVRELEAGDAETIVFVGQASAGSLSAAENAANDDLSAAVARFIAVSIASESEATDTHESENGRVKETTEAHVETRAHVEATLGKVVADARYWEKVSLRTGAPSYRFFLRAAVKRSELARARRTIACERARRAGKKIVVLAYSDKVFEGFEDRLASERRDLYVLAPKEVGPNEARELSADVILELTRQSAGESVTLGYVLRGGENSGFSGQKEVRGEEASLFELEDQLWVELRGALGSGR